MNSQMPSVKRHGVSLPPPLEKCANSADENDYKAVIGPRFDPDRSVEASYISIQSLSNQILELQVRFLDQYALPFSCCLFLLFQLSLYSCVFDISSVVGCKFDIYCCYFIFVVSISFSWNHWVCCCYNLLLLETTSGRNVR